MTYNRYLRDQWIYMLIYLTMMFLILAVLLSFHVNKSLILVVMVIMLVGGNVILLWNYQRKKMFYHNYLQQLNALDQKYLICELIKEPYFLEGQILYQSLYEINKSMLEKINELEMQVTNFKDYVEMWIHEVKIPLSHLTLTVHNHRSEISPQILEQVRKLENQVDQVLYYVRCENSQKDYLIKSSSLSKIINNIIMKNKDYFIFRKLNLNLHDLDKTVLTDSKWLEFIINQILNNSFQYCINKTETCIEISAVEDDDKVVLMIQDNGIGICESDLPRVFDKCFTGYNGRIQKKSTGMGLYICRRLCQRLGHHIDIESIQNEYTKVLITFHKDHYYDVIR